MPPNNPLDGRRAINTLVPRCSIAAVTCNRWDFCFLQQHRTLGLDPERICPAVLVQRAFPAGGRPWRADERTQFHDRLVIITGSLSWDELFRQDPQFFFTLRGVDRRLDIEYAGEDAFHISVQHRFNLTKSDGGNGCSGVTSDAGECFEFAPRAGQGSVWPSLHFLCSFQQITRPTVIAKTFPDPQDILFAGRCQRLQAWKACHPALEIGDDRIHPGLLSHNFRDPDGVGIRKSPPGKLSGMLLIPD